MRRIFCSISSRQVLVISTVIFLLCIGDQWERRIRTRQAVSERPVPRMMLQDAPDSVINVEQVQGFAVMFQLCPSGKLESVTPIWTRPDKSFMLRAVFEQDDGTLLTFHVVLEGLEVVDTPNGVQLMRASKPRKHQMIAEGREF